MLVRCGCCDNSLEIYFSPDDDFLEINGVMGSKAE